MAKGAPAQLGISFGAETLYLIEMAHAGKRPEITHLMHVSLEMPFSYNAIGDQAAQEYLGLQVRDALDSAGITTTAAGLAVDTGMAIIKRLPYDASLKRKGLDEHVSWEVSQYVNLPLTEYHFAHHELLPVKVPGDRHLVLVAVKRQIIEAVREIAATAALDLRLVEVDAFAALNALDANYTLEPEEHTALVEVGPDRLVFQILRGVHLLGLHQVPSDTEDPEAAPSAEHLSQEIARQLRFYATDYDVDANAQEFSRVFLYKTHAGVDLKRILEYGDVHNAEILDPFAGLALAAAVEDDMDRQADNSPYAEAVGLALHRV